MDGKVFSLGNQLSFQDMEGNELAFIRQKLLAWGPTYEIYRQGELQAIVKKSLFTLFQCRFSVDVPGPDDLEATGNFIDHEYSFTRGAGDRGGRLQAVAHLTDSYGVDIAEGEDDILILASTVVIDLACHGDRRQG